MGRLGLRASPLSASSGGVLLFLHANVSPKLEHNASLPPERRVEFPVGIHLGDVVKESNKLATREFVNTLTRGFVSRGRFERCGLLASGDGVVLFMRCQVGTTCGLGLKRSSSFKGAVKC
jgi:hypothetical protein